MRNYSSLVVVLVFAIFACGGSTAKSETETKSSDQKIESEKQMEVQRVNDSTSESTLVEVTEKENKDAVKIIEEKVIEVEEIIPSEEVSEQEVEKIEEVVEIEVVKEVEEVVEVETVKDLSSYFSDFNALLSKHVSSNGKVNYKGFLGDKEKLDNYISGVKTVGIAQGHSRNEQLAFWINLYNACTLQLICDNYPVKSIKDINGGKPWDLKVVEVDGKSYSLNEIENDLIRPRFKEPRIHFAVNCAAKSCPKLLNRAFFPNKLDADLTIATKEFLSNSSQNQFDGDKAAVSKIFDWYSVDFGNLINFINKYSSHNLSEAAVVSYNEYDWSLNE